MSETMKSAQQTLIKIANELRTAGFNVEILKNENKDIKCIVLFSTNGNNIYGIESSDTLSLNDVAYNLPEEYFHIGCFEKYQNAFMFRYFALQELSENLVNNILNIIEKYENAPEELSVLLKKYDLWKENESLFFEESD